MNVEEAKRYFSKLLQTVQPSCRESFLSWIESDILNNKEEADVIMETIAEEIRLKVPEDAILSSEKLFTPIAGETTERTLHVDSFLFDDDFVDGLVDQGKFSRNYCVDCSSKNTKPFEFISHSSSTAELKVLYKQVLPSLQGKKLIDIGSRLGPVLYTACLYASPTHVIGIELNDDLCRIQKEIIDKYGMKDRISVVCRDVLLCEDLLKEGDVIVMNNVFDYFTNPKDLLKMWSFMMRSLRRRGQLIVTYPSLQQSLQTVEMSREYSDWVKEEDLGGIETDFHLYSVK